MPSPQYNPRRQHREPPKKVKRSGASPTHREREGINVPWWLWVIVGTALGIFVSFLIHLAQSPKNATAQAVALQKMQEEKTIEKNSIDKNSKPSAEQKSQEKNLADGATSKTTDENKNVKPDETKTVTKFDFYTLLPEREVIVPTDREAREAIKAAEKNKTANEQQTNPSSAANEQLFLQVGSFRSAQEADKRRTQIKTLGLDTKVEEVISNSDTWYRVQAGPFTSREQLSKAREQLKAAGIESLLLRQKQG